MEDNSHRHSLHNKPLPADAPALSMPSPASPQEQPIPQPPQVGDQPQQSQEHSAPQQQHSYGELPYPPPPQQPYSLPRQGDQHYPPARQGQYPSYQGPPPVGFYPSSPIESQAQPNQYAYQQGPPPQASPTYPQGYQQQSPPPSSPNAPQGYYQQGPPVPYPGHGYYQQGPPPPHTGQNSPYGYYQQGPPPPHHSGHPQNQYAQHPRAFYDAYGMPTDELRRYTTAMFNFLDATYAPKNTGAIEQSKIKSFMEEGLGTPRNRNIGYLPPNQVEDFYNHFGIKFTKKLAPPNIANAVNVASKVFKGANFLANALGGGTGFGGGGGSMFGGGMGGGSSQAALLIPAIDKDGFNTLVSNLAKRNPNGMFAKLNEVIRKYRLSLPLVERSQLPFAPDPQTVQQFNSYEQVMLMKMQMNLKSTQMMANLAVQGAHNVQQASLPAGYYYTRN
ncbi:hypothetical protein INT44_001304 [Umbelopsis vinacea]|uniref:Uncharacterized protein n=1 Tax=Umbelopsis vinacea TaxID=44442 RepID=A0A8H7QB14_9FUNG|nr:hypothetical protein INT44_001304 [Umbelopsis vinacea]